MCRIYATLNLVVTGYDNGSLITGSDNGSLITGSDIGAMMIVTKKMTILYMIVVMVVMVLWERVETTSMAFDSTKYLV